MEKGMKISQKVKNWIAYDPVIPLMVIIKNNSNKYLEDIFAPIVALFIITQDVD